MSPENQLLIPERFSALYIPPGRHKPSLPWAELAQRHELCEDLAQMLTEQAANQFATHRLEASQILERCLAGLHASPELVSDVEARWVICRLAELLQWPQPEWAQDLGAPHS